MVIIRSHEEFESYLNKELGVSSWHTITQEQINNFADATLDHQWIHTDPERARKCSPFKATIAHGYLVLSLLPFFWKQIVDVQNILMEVNYGLEQLKFAQAVVVNSEVRCRVTLRSIINLRNITKATLFIQLEIKDQLKPAFTGNVLFLYHFINDMVSTIPSAGNGCHQ
ncbi:MaoC family dehydratase [Parafilimonas sp.]|uniref:MaoC family dehydratase n=1 Tax=Parafilimonas sp. TaxID=1969739 RepID=UPI003F815C39